MTLSIGARYSYFFSFNTSKDFKVRDQELLTLDFEVNFWSGRYNTWGFGHSRFFPNVLQTSNFFDTVDDSFRGNVENFYDMQINLFYVKFTRGHFVGKTKWFLTVGISTNRLNIRNVETSLTSSQNEILESASEEFDNKKATASVGTDILLAGRFGSLQKWLRLQVSYIPLRVHGEDYSFNLLGNADVVSVNRDVRNIFLSAALVLSLNR
ncbi:hypothetical protein FNH22_27990 [Fulvivirga sp. M361]|uniref:hypothetical protein n=1 Tax=Fulvivirga sp. M361 TaxID=2594266 RepID=UPI00117BB17B|nr:hypothetical protein [Fulvivirga sp. M361]TRX49075.1 hypothetical protein FNH22_27990 [Fulvivirga sp. M361]